jgi:hypothetical protein
MAVAAETAFAQKRIIVPRRLVCQALAAHELRNALGERGFSLNPKIAVSRVGTI